MAYNQDQMKFAKEVQGFITNTLKGSTYWSWVWKKDIDRYELDQGIKFQFRTWDSPFYISYGDDTDLSTEVYFPQEYRFRVYNIGKSEIAISSMVITNEVECAVTEISSLPATIPAGEYAEHTISIDPITLGETFSFVLTYQTDLPGSGEYNMAFHGTFFDAYQTETRLGESAELDMLTLDDEEVVSTLAGLIPADSRLIVTRVVFDTTAFSGITSITVPPIISLGVNVSRNDILPGITYNGVNEVGDKLTTPVAGLVGPIDNGDGTIGAKVSTASTVVGALPEWKARVILYGFFLENLT